MDRVHLEPGHGLHEDQPGLQALLRRADGEAAAGDGAAELSSAASSVSLHEHACSSCRSAWKKPQTVFVNSMSDLFHEDVPAGVHPARVRRHAAGVTGTPSRCSPSGPSAWSRWTRCSTGRRTSGWASASRRGSTLYRLDHLRRTPAQVRFLSFEPLLGALGELDLDGIDWVIVGGESGPGARPMDDGLGDRHPRPVPARRRAVLLQAVGRDEQEEGRPPARRPHLGRDASRLNGKAQRRPLAAARLPPRRREPPDNSARRDLHLEKRHRQSPAWSTLRSF